MVDPPPFSNDYLKKMNIMPEMITAVIITHCHADHDAGAFEKILL
jgi:glyoxylase-like metal-dependent hydrolase (beta-lactamase superfamily II)